MSDRPSLSSGLSFGALSFGAGAILAIVSSVVTARLYGVEVIGEFALVAAPAAVLWFLSDAGEQTASVRLLVDLPNRHPRVTGIFVAVSCFSLVLTAVVGALVMAGAYLLLNGPIGRPGLVAPAAVNTLGCICISNPAWNLETPLKAFMAGRELFWIRLVQALVFLAVAIFLSFHQADVWALVIATIASWGISLLHRLVVIRPFVDFRPEADHVRAGFALLPEILRYGIKIVPGMLSSGISYEIGIWVLGLKSSVAVVGSYSRAWSIIRRFAEVNWRISEMLFPALIARRSNGDQVGFARASLDTMRYVLLLALLPAAVGGGGAETIMAIFGPGFVDGSGALAILVLVPPLSLLVTAQVTVLLATDRPGASSVVSVLQMLLTVVATFLLTDWLGILGPALALVGGFVFSLGLQGLMLRSTFEVPLRSLFPLSHAVGAMLAYAAGFLVSRLCSELIGGMLPSLLAISVLGSAAYAGVVYLIARPLPRDRERLNSVLGRISPKLAVAES
jgi:O-antigen/teichoic acid export membrane protein